MKGILITIGFILCLATSFSQAPVPRASNAITAVDQHVQVAQSLSIPAPYDTTAINGLDSVGLIIYSRRYTGLYIRDTFPGGKKWTRVLKSGDAGTGVITFNTRSGTVTLLSADVTTALGYVPIPPNGTNLQYKGGDGSNITFPTIPAQFNPIAGYGMLITGSYPNKTFTSDTSVLFPAVRATIPAGGGITSLNGLTGATQTFGTGTAGTDFGISSSGTTHTFNFPIVSPSNTGKVTPTLFNLWNAKWGLTGNAGTIDGTSFIGTTDNIPLTLRVNNQPSARITSSGNQTYFGYQAGNGANSQFTTAIGFQALQNNIGNYSTAIGYQALQNNTSGVHNVGIGLRALGSNTTGINNAAIGDNALTNNTSGQENMAIGSSAFNNLTTAQFGVALGWDAGASVTTGDSTVAIGSESGFNVTTGRLNTFLGTHTGWGIITGSYNTIIGSNVTGLAAALNNNIIIADGAGNKRLTIDSFGTSLLTSTTALGLPSGNTAQRPSSPVAGYTRFNTDSTAQETFNGAIWVKAGSSTGGGGSGTVTSVGATTGTSGTDFTISGSPITGTGSFTFNLPVASGTNTGKLSNTDWTTFNNKQNAITLTTTGSSGPATFISNTLNIPQYSGGGGSPTLNHFQVGFGDASNLLTGSARFVFDSVLSSGIVNTQRLSIYAIPDVYGGVPTTGLSTLNDQGLRVFSPFMALGVPGYQQPSIMEFLNPYDTAKKTRMISGWAGGKEFNQGYNFNYRDQVHHPYDSSEQMVYTYLGPDNGYGMQVVWKNHCASCTDWYNSYGFIPWKFSLTNNGANYTGADFSVRGTVNIFDTSAANQNLDAGRHAQFGISGGALKLVGIPEFDITDTTFVSMGGIADNQSLLSVRADNAFGKAIKIWDYENNSNALQLYAERKKGSSFTLTAGTPMLRLNTNTIGFLDFRASADAPSGFTSPDLAVRLQDASGAVNEDFTVLHTGKVGINNATPAVGLVVTATDAVGLTVGTTAQRPTGANGYIRYNSDSSKLEFYNGTWNSLGVSTAGGAVNSVNGLTGTVSINWSSVLDQGGTLAANKHYNLGGNAIDFNHANGLGLSIRGVNPEWDWVDTVNALTGFIKNTGGYLELGGGTGMAVKTSKSLQTMDASSPDLTYGLNAGTIRAITTNPTSMAATVLLWNSGTTGDQLQVLAQPINNAFTIKNNGTALFGTSTTDNGSGAIVQVQGKVTLTADSVGTATGGCLFRDAATGLIKRTACGGGSSTPDTLHVINRGVGLLAGNTNGADSLFLNNVNGLLSIVATKGSDSSNNFSLLNDTTNSLPAGYYYSTNSTGRKGWYAVPASSSATYTPTLTATTNITSPVLTQASYIKSGNVIHVIIGGTFTPTLTATSSVLTFTLPFTTTTTTQLYIGNASIAYNSGALGYFGGLVSINAGTTGILEFTPTVTTGSTAKYSLSFDYIL